jgi:methylphosphotriester-DNA--protein-cysteine methyltransferase
MIHHQDLTSAGFAGKRQLAVMLLQGHILFAGNRRLKIYGTLGCSSGKRMKTVNRVFFADEQEALDSGYRPCAHCLREKYRSWQRN